MMSEKLPYYMVYPVPFAFDEERNDRRDYEYMKSMYPDAARKILPFVEEECDRCEHPLSMMYDEYPDRLQLRMMCSRICKRIKENHLFEDGHEAEPVGAAGRDDWLRDLTAVILYQELLRRRAGGRRARRRYY